MGYYDKHNNDGTDFIAAICFGVIILILIIVMFVCSAT